MRTLKTFLTGVCLCLAICLHAQEKMNLAGVYEANSKVEGTTKQIYAVLDFNTFGAKDFTQLFTGKTAQFKLLPEDFMNAKKLKRRFAGSTAAGFVKYREKYLFTFIEELKLTNPRMEEGMIVADWENNAGVKGKCGIIVKDDNSIEFVGLTSLDRTLNPDGVVATCVEDRCLADVPRAKGTPEGVENYLAEYNKKPEPAPEATPAVASAASASAPVAKAGEPMMPHRTANTKLIALDSDYQGVTAYRFSNGLAYVSTSKNGKFYMDKSGNKIFEYYPQQYGFIPLFSEDGVAIDCEKFTTGILFNKKGEIVRKIPNIYKVTNFVDGIAAVTITVPARPLSRHENVYMNTKGEIVFKNLAEPQTMENLKEVRPMRDSLVAYYSYGKKLWGFRDAKGKAVVVPQFLEAHDFSEGMAAVQIQTDGGAKKWGYIDKAGTFVIQPNYSNEPGDFNNGLSFVINKENKYFYIDKSGKIVSPAYSWATNFLGGTAMVKAADGEGYAINPSFKNLARLSRQITGLKFKYIGNDIYVENYLLTGTGAVLIKGISDPFYEDLAATYTNSYKSTDGLTHIGYINRKGEYVLEFVESEF
ncbi:WG repeat-containing protein [Bacteroides timonensis]|uniref:WG repeat-containing protein n=1 Tax=Bacteroides timonensis TaxID=1470345 RepID=UPI0004AFEFD4|nr:WG repeat-containing protein [Bacteroides timonensis]